MDDQTLLAASGPGAVMMYALVKDIIPKVIEAVKGSKPSGSSIPPKEFLETKAQVSENRTNIAHLTNSCQRLATTTDKLFDKIDSLGDKLDQNNGALMKLYGRVEQALRER